MMEKSQKKNIKKQEERKKKVEKCKNEIKIHAKRMEKKKK